MSDRLITLTFALAAANEAEHTIMPAHKGCPFAHVFLRCTERREGCAGIADRQRCLCPVSRAAHGCWGMCPESYDVQGSLDASTEELALCSSIADFRNCIFPSEAAWSSHDVRGFTDTLILQLFDVRCCLAALAC